MKTFELKKRSKFEDKIILKDVCSHHAERGINIDRMRLMVKVLDKLEAANGTISLEDAEHAVLLDQLKVFPFSIAHKDLVELHDSITNAKTEPVTRE